MDARKKMDAIANKREYLEGLMRVQCPVGKPLCHCPLLSWRRLPVALVSNSELVQILETHLRHAET